MIHFEHSHMITNLSLPRKYTFDLDKNELYIGHHYRHDVSKALLGRWVDRKHILLTFHVVINKSILRKRLPDILTKIVMAESALWKVNSSLYHTKINVKIKKVDKSYSYKYYGKIKKYLFSYYPNIIRIQNEMVAVASFNVLSSSYCNKSTYPSYDEKVINNKLRWEKLSVILINLMKEGTFICLQEVSEFYRAKLEVLVRQNGYLMIATNYDHFHSGYMGVATLYPAKYLLEDCQFIRPSTLVRKHIKPEYEEADWSWVSLFSFSSFKPKECEWYRKISMKNNVLLVATFIIDGKSVTIANYHAPCVYKCTKSMCVVAACLLKTLNDINSANLYFAGDLNIQPDSLPYQILRTGQMVTNDFDLLLLAGDIDDMELFGFDSAHYKIYSKEPDHTIKTETNIRGEYNSFTGCLDYILYRADHPKSVNVYPSSNELLPSETWPSDHKMVVATF